MSTRDIFLRKASYPCKHRYGLEFSIKHKILHLVLCILLAGDIATNPGPTLPNAQFGNLSPSHLQVPVDERPKNEFGPAIALANMMSLAPKIDELRCFVENTNPDLISLTETWLNDSISEHHLNIPGYNLLLKNRTSGVHGGVGLYIKNSIKFNALTDIYHPQLEVLWTYIKPTRLPRGIPCVIVGTVYHTHYPVGASDNAMLDYLASSLTVIEGRYPGCGILITGDFNRLNVSRLLKQFKLKQLVRGPTRGERTLDLIITNMPQLYDKNLLQSFPPFGLSDHSVLLLQPKPRTVQSRSRRSVTRRDTRLSRRHELGRYLSSIDWSFLDSVTGCESKFQLFLDLVKTGLDTIMPLKPVKLHVNDAPWISPEFKTLIKLRQKAYAQGDQDRFRQLRHVVNRERKVLRSRYYTSRVANLKNTKPSQWWNEVKKISGMVPAAPTGNIRSQLHISGIDGMSNKDITDLINTALLEPMQIYQPLDCLPPIDENSEVLKLDAYSVYSALLTLNPRKASGPDEVPNWLLKDYADFLANPVCDILNSSFDEQALPASWKYANVTPLPKTKPVTIIAKHIRPISLTPTLSKLAEDFVVRNDVGLAILEIIDPNQFGAVPK